MGRWADGCTVPHRRPRTRRPAARAARDARPGLHRAGPLDHLTRARRPRRHADAPAVRTRSGRSAGPEPGHRDGRVRHVAQRGVPHQPHRLGQLRRGPARRAAQPVVDAVDHPQRRQRGQRRRPHRPLVRDPAGPARRRRGRGHRCHGAPGALPARRRLRARRPGRAAGRGGRALHPTRRHHPARADPDHQRRAARLRPAAAPARQRRRPRHHRAPDLSGCAGRDPGQRRAGDAGSDGPGRRVAG